MSNLNTGGPLAIVCPGPVKQSVRIVNLAQFEQAVTADKSHPTHRFVTRILSCYPDSVSWIDVWPDADWANQPAPDRFDEEKPPTPTASRAPVYSCETGHIQVSWFGDGECPSCGKPAAECMRFAPRSEP